LGNLCGVITAHIIGLIDNACGVEGGVVGVVADRILNLEVVGVVSLTIDYYYMFWGRGGV